MLNSVRFLTISTITLSSLMLLGAGCNPGQSTNNLSNSGNKNTTTVTNVTVTTPADPSGDSAADQAAVEDTLNQMTAAQAQAEAAASSASDSDSVDSYTIPTSLPQ